MQTGFRLAFDCFFKIRIHIFDKKDYFLNAKQNIILNFVGFQEKDINITLF